MIVKYAYQHVIKVSKYTSKNYKICRVKFQCLLYFLLYFIILNDIIYIYGTKLLYLIFVSEYEHSKLYIVN